MKKTLFVVLCLLPVFFSSCKGGDINYNKPDKDMEKDTEEMQDNAHQHNNNSNRS